MKNALYFSSMSVLIAQCFMISISAAPVVHTPGTMKVNIALRPASTVIPTSDYFVRLDSIAVITGGTKKARAKTAAVLVARAPQSGDIRTITPGDVALKLREYGIDPDTQTLISGPETESIQVTQGTVPLVTAPATGGGKVPAGAGASVPSIPLIHRDDPVELTIQDGDMTITAEAIACDPGALGDTIKIRRNGVAEDMSVVVTGPHTVSLEN